METRIEHDSMGEVSVPAHRYWGAQTQRSLNNFQIGKEKMPDEVIEAFALLKKAAALANRDLGKLDPGMAQSIALVCDEILDGAHDGEFPLSVWQTGSGTHTNMNLNEVIANRINELQPMQKAHPNDTVNMGQSSNDTFPSAMHIAAILMIERDLLPACTDAAITLHNLRVINEDIVKLGRTHLQDATPLTLGQEISGWYELICQARDMVEISLEPLRALAIGATAVGTGINTHPRFGACCAQLITELTATRFVSSANKFHSLTSLDALVSAHGALKALACNLMKIANDIRLLASGPRGGLGELLIPENEPGSSIMPGKVNPTQCEAVTMVAVRVMGNDTVIGIAASQGNLQLNTFLPVTIDAFLQSVRLLSDVLRSFDSNCLQGITANQTRIELNLRNSLMLVTALSPHIGYEKAALIARTAYNNDISLREAAAQLELLNEQEFDALINPQEMVGR